MTERFTAIFLCLFFLCLSSATANAAPQGGDDIPEGMRQRMLERFDRNGDGELDAEEEKAMRTAMESRRRGGQDRGRRGRGRMRTRNEQITKKFDEDGDGKLNAEERVKARVAVKKSREGQRRFGRRGRPGESTAGVNDTAGVFQPISPKDVVNYPKQSLYDQSTLRTIFLEFPQKDWFEELSDFHRTDVEIPARMIVDGVAYPEVGVRFRGNTSFMMVQGRKKSLNIAVDYDGESSLKGYRTLNLLNGHTDPSFMREVLFSTISRFYVGAPQANFVNVVVNGENFGVYANVQQVNKDLMKESYGSGKGFRWKVPANFSGDGGMRYLGEDLAKYKAAYTLKQGKADKAWPKLIEACKVLAETPDEQLAEVLPHYFAVDEILWHLALDNVFQDDDGYFSRASDYQIFCDKSGRFHLITHDNNETFRPAGRGPGARRGGRRGPPGGGPGGDGPPPGGGPPGFGPPRGGGPPPAGADSPGRPGIERPAPGGQTRRAASDPYGRDPLQHASADPKNRPLIARLLAVPAWRARYLHHVKTLMEDELAWPKLSLRIDALRPVISDAMKNDQKLLYGFEAFEKNLDGDAGTENRRSPAIKTFATKRHEFLSKHAALKGAWPTIQDVTAKEYLLPDGRKGLEVRARLDGEVAADHVVLWSAKGTKDPLAATTMYDDGKHGDGAAGDGVFAGRSVVHKPGKKIRYYVEAIALKKSPKADYWPKHGEINPLVHQIENE